MKSNIFLMWVVIAGFLFSSRPVQADTEFGEVTEAVAVIQPTEGNAVQGVVRFSQIGERLRVSAAIEGLTPDSRHGFHIHEFGDARASNGTSAGGHYNPDHHDHALPESGSLRHAGDLGNLEADANGYATYVSEQESITIDGAHNPVLGRAVIIHAQADDGGQPTGNAGPRIGIGLIGIANPDF